MTARSVSACLYVLLLLGLPSISKADTFAGVFVGGQIWDVTADGAFGTSDATQDFSLDDETNGSVWIAVEHFFPLVPNVKLRFNQLDTQGDATVSGFTFDDVTFDGDSQLDTDLDHLDIILYYEIADTDFVSLDVGATLKYADYEVQVTGITTLQDGTQVTATSEEGYDGILPMLYVAGSLGWSYTGVGVYGELNWLGYDDSNGVDFQVGGYWHFLDNPAIQASLLLGYRRIDVDVEDISNVYIDTEWDGAFGGIQLHF